MRKARQAVYTAFCLGMMLVTALLLTVPHGTYAAGTYKPVNVEIEVVCANIEGATGEKYLIELEPANEFCPLPDNSPLSIAADSKGYFTISVPEPGTYKYRVQQIDMTSSNIQYDRTIYGVTIDAELKNNELVTIIYFTSNESPEKIFVDPEEIIEDDQKTVVATLTFENKVLAASETDPSTNNNTTASTVSTTASENGTKTTTKNGNFDGGDDSNSGKVPLYSTTEATVHGTHTQPINILDSDGDVVFTGDQIRIGLICIVLGIAAIAAIVSGVMIIRRKKDGGEQ